MWLWQALSSGFSYEVHDGRVQLYRVLIGVAVLLKAGGTAFLGDWNRLRPGSFGRMMLESRQGSARAELVSRVHKPLIVARMGAGAMLLIGILPKVALALAILGFLQELSYEYHFNTIYMILCLCCLLPAGRLGRWFDFSDELSSANTWSQFLIVLITIDVYWNSAYQKIRSPQFISGLSLVQQAYIASTVRSQMPNWEYAHPRLGATRTAAAGAVPIHWRLLAVAVVALELALPVGLLLPDVRPLAVAAGIGLHIAFLGILPLRLAPFTLLTVASAMSMRCLVD